jgi:hypothetical protein
MSKGDHATTPGSGSANSVRRDGHSADPEAIAKRAYELFLQRGSVSGNEVDDWLQAEAELTNRGEEASTAPAEARETAAPPQASGDSPRRPETRERAGQNRRGARPSTSH